jgi:hypothetical protein
MVEASTPYGFLVSEQPATHNIGMPYTGHPGTYKPHGTDGRDAALRVRRCRRLRLSPRLSDLPCSRDCGVLRLHARTFPVGAIIALLSLLGLAIGAAVGSSDNASPSDENPALGGDLHASGILVVAGSWVYDSGHQPSGWNEIHPIKFASPIGHWDGEWPADINALETLWGIALGGATSTTVIELQKQPQNQWQVHPILDGCEPVVIV